MPAKPPSVPAPPDLSSLCLAIAEHAPLPMATVEGAHHFVRYVNPAFCRLLNKPSQQLVGKQFREILPEKDICVTLLDRVFRSGKPESHTEQEQAIPHPVFWSYTMWPVIDRQHTFGVMIQVTETAQFHEKTLAMNQALMLGSVRQHELTAAADSSNALLQTEIGERKLVENSLHLAQAQLTDRAGQLQGLVTERTSELTATNNQLEAFVYTIAHDLRAPLRSMRGFSDMLVEEAGASLSELARDYASRIHKSAEFMDDLLGDLLAFSRISQQHVELTPVKLGPIVASVLSRLEPDIQEKHARVDSSGPWPVVLAHEPTLSQVLFNLASNALKFTLPGVPPQIRLRAELRHYSTTSDANIPLQAAAQFDQTSATVRVGVEDNGPGIAPEHQAQIFRLFTRLHGAQYPGTGIGLAIVQKGVERMGGRVGVESEFGQGSRFWLELQRA